MNTFPFYINNHVLIASEMMQVVKRTEPGLLDAMAIHYSQPKGFVGRNICYKVGPYGYIVGGSATRFLPGRDLFLGWSALTNLNAISNNIFYHIEPKPKYPFRNFTVAVLQAWEILIQKDWLEKYGNQVLALESLVELPRTGECYRRAGWTEVGLTKGYTCKRIAGQGTDTWSGKRVWDVKNLRPKRVFIKDVSIYYKQSCADSVRDDADAPVNRRKQL